MSYAGVAMEQAERNKKLETELKEARTTILEMQSLIDIWRKRVDHVDIEMSQARISRDSYRGKLEMLMTRMKEQGITIVIGSVSETKVKS